MWSALIVAAALAVAADAATSDAAATAPAAAVSERLARARAHREAFELETAVPAARAIVDDTAAPQPERLEAMLILGYAYGALGRLVEADEVFRAAVAIDPDLVAPFPMELKIKVLLEAARLEERQRRDGERRAARKRLEDALVLKVRPPDDVVGATRARFSLTLAGPAEVTSRVRSVRIDFRKQGEPEFSALPLRDDGGGLWRGEIPGMSTRTKVATHIEWFITVSDDEGVLKGIGSRAAPQLLPLKPGFDVALDLKANERLSTPSRLFLGFVASPAATLAAGATGFGVAAAIETVGAGNGVMEALAFLSYVALPPLFSVGANFLVTQFLIDDAQSLIPAFSCAVAAGVYALAAVALYLTNRGGFVAYVNPSSDKAFSSDGFVPVAVSLLAVGTEVVLASAVPGAMVAFDLPE